MCRDLDIRGIFLRLLDKRGSRAGENANMRVFDAGRGGELQEVAARALWVGNRISGLFRALIALRHHMRWIGPLDDRKKDKWRDRIQGFAKVVQYWDAMSWYKCRQPGIAGPLEMARTFTCGVFAKSFEIPVGKSAYWR